MAQKKLAGDFRGKARFDLLSAVMVCNDQYSYQRKTTPLHGLLGTLFSTKLTPDEKMALLREEYGIETTVEVKEGMKRMCNLNVWTVKTIEIFCFTTNVLVHCEIFTCSAVFFNISASCFNLIFCS